MSSSGEKEREVQWDAVVVGAGIVGSWTAYHLTQRGLRTLVLDQFALPHTRGSSHGKSRLISMDLPTNDESFPLMQLAYTLWRQLEERTQRQLLHTTGLLWIDTDGTAIPDATGFLEKNAMPFESLSPEELRRRYPQAEFGEGARGLLDPGPGMLIADTCVRLLHRLIVENGGVIQDAEKMTSFSPVAGHVTLSTSKGTYRTRKLVICAGPWAKDVLDQSGIQLPVKTMPGLQLYWSVKEPAKDDHNKLPMIYHPTKTTDGYRIFLLFPTLEYPGMVKVLTRGEPPECYLHPDQRDSRGHDAMISRVAAYVRTHYPGINDKPSIVEPCVYTMSPDRGFIMDYHPHCKDVLFGAGFSGNGFKFSPAVGEMLSDMVTGRESSERVYPFRMNRYKTSSSSTSSISSSKL